MDLRVPTLVTGYMHACTLTDDPWTFYTDSGERIKKGFTKNAKPFNSTQSKDLIYRIYGADCPGPEYYSFGRNGSTGVTASQKYVYPATPAATVTVFTSKSLQRPESKSEVPAPDRYDPNFMSTKATIRDAGAHMRSKSSRWGVGNLPGTDGTTRDREDVGTGPMGPHGPQRTMTPDGVGPGKYAGAEYERTLQEDCDEHIRRSSRLYTQKKMGFGSTSAQRKLPMYGSPHNPEPGAYYPYEPRQKYRVLKEFAHVKAVTDNDVRDEEAGFAREEAARKSKERRAAERAQLRRRNAEMRKRINETKAATDNDVTDDASGAARRRMAAESAARKAAGNAQLARENAAMHTKIANTVAATDDDVTDEAAGVARRQAAVASRQRKDAEAAALAAENAEYYSRLGNVQAVTDNDISGARACMPSIESGRFQPVPLSPAPNAYRGC